MRPRSVVPIALASLLLPASLPAGDAGEFCSSLQALVKAGGDGFESIKGEAAGKGDRWKSKAALTGARECTISKSRDGSRVTCSIAWDSDRAVVEPSYDEAKKKVAECLAGWGASDEASAIDPKAAVFTSAESAMKVGVRLTNAGTAFNVTVSVVSRAAK
jgi:hypothetical protein